MLVDGLSSSELGSIVSDMKALGTIFFTVGIGDVNGDVLEQIASTPTAAGLQQEEHPNFYYLSSFTAFGEMVNFLNESTARQVYNEASIIEHSTEMESLNKLGVVYSRELLGSNPRLELKIRVLQS
uniref:VWFA domain-containing protein n=1 Tax=Timema douglasi TaxID=61478 RepID=A0A7R8W2S6_TIMDO|nr:unnamed protein product [Timema douglasi]